MTANGEKKRSASQWHLDAHAKYGEHPPFIKDVGSALLSDARPGVAHLAIKEVTLGDPAEERTMVDGAVVTIGVPLREIRGTLGGDEGDWVHPATGEHFHISLREWAGRDPDSTLLQLKFTYKPLK